MLRLDRHDSVLVASFFLEAICSHRHNFIFLLSVSAVISYPLQRLSPAGLKPFFVCANQDYVTYICLLQLAH